MSSYKPALHWLAFATACATFPLIFLGGLVTSKQAGMSVPDWPNSFGYNMFAFPPSQWVGGIFFEHTHRLMGSLVGILCIALVICTWYVEERRWVRWLSCAVLGLVIAQGVLGGLRVVLVKLDLAIVHACVAQAFFCLATFMAIVTSRGWFEPSVPMKPLGDAKLNAGKRLLILGILAVVVIYLQLVGGAFMRHYKAGLAITDFPLSYGKLLPPISTDGLTVVNRQRWLDRLEGQPIDATVPVTLAQVWLHFAHRLGALVVSIVLMTFSIQVLRRHQRQVWFAGPAIALLGLLAAQITLGILTVLLRKPADIASLHVAMGALTLMTTFLLTIRLARGYYSPPTAQPAGGFQVIFRDQAVEATQATVLIDPQ